MSSSISGPRRAAPSAVNTPVSVRVASVSCIDNEEAQVLLTKFLEDAEKVDSVITQLSSNNSATIAQLKRCQRELRGLTPLALDLLPALKLGSTISSSTEQPKNKKIKFDDSVDAGGNEDQVGSEDEIEDKTVPGLKIDKEERKRLKKERRKEEKKRKLQQSE